MYKWPMDIIRLYNPLTPEIQQKLKAYKGCAVVIGNFDGVHLGHQELIKASKKNGKKSVVITFSPHPEEVFNKSDQFFKIFSEHQNIERFKLFDVDAIIIVPFEKEIFSLSANDFLKNIIIKTIEPRHIVVGKDFKFGHKREGDIRFLEEAQATYGYKLNALPKLSDEGVIISSSVIREHLMKGEIEKANLLLGKEPFFIEGEIISGQKLGHQIGFPTANIIDVRVPLKKGVYKTRVLLDGQMYDSISNFGSKPTVNNDLKVKTLETFILNFSKNIYGKKMTVYFDQFIREEIKFSNIEELKTQISKDVQQAYLDTGSTKV